MNNALGLDFNYLFAGFYPPSFSQIIMILIGAYLIYMSIYYNKKPLLLLPMGVAILAANMPLPKITEDVINGFLGMIYNGASSGVYSVLVFFAVGTMIDLGLVLADPKNFFIGASSQIGIFVVFFMISNLMGSDVAAATSIIGAADGSLAMYMTTLVTDARYFAPIVMASYLYMELLPILQIGVTKFLTTKKERTISMSYLRHVSRGEKIIFAVIAMSLCGIFLANSFPLIAALLFGSILRESDIIKNFSVTLQKSLTGILTMLIGIAIGSSASADTFISLSTILIFVFGFVSLILNTVIGVIVAKIINVLTGGKVNPIIGSAGLSAFPVPAWGAHIYGQENSSSNCLLLHAMAVNISGIISGAITVGIFLTFFHN
ncbi:sodium ion-translocating decarboxylase subunit beta [Brachyspira pilosicoli]|nr:sodium ion-translocating decarboxylase subunit beta [Brachyspira pilosicoli]AGA67204.1 Na-transporting methylmalonyl CoA oxaloacetate decarboxylase subunit beta [Brachyspira pilosicoli P43/6/78]MBW5377288.1 sodium ion-translocating decarboxylase subunit beta [Brachyspira pilosicoli]MBW5382845.1 sodium ion-translocating decarboxylase subunit beta [Brachyspira pilosicoli]MBW5392610.1 sodium ion-translocating decarboxylase subunit beta [Brachyspira pilosicoli]MBW5399713.1 sodium ion-translocat